ncbi:MAG: BrnT family toxin [bacterium]
MHLWGEERFQALGQSSGKRKLFISYTIWNNRIRIVSARDMSMKERKKFKDEEIKKTLTTLHDQFHEIVGACMKAESNDSKAAQPASPDVK